MGEFSSEFSSKAAAGSSFSSGVQCEFDCRRRRLGFFDIIFNFLFAAFGIKFAFALRFAFVFLLLCVKTLRMCNNIIK